MLKKKKEEGDCVHTHERDSNLGILECVNNDCRITGINKDCPLQTTVCGPGSAVSALPISFMWERRPILFRSLLRFLPHEAKPNPNRYSQGIRQSLIWSLETWLHLELPVWPQPIPSALLRFLLLLGQKRTTTPFLGDIRNWVSHYSLI